MKSHIDTGGRLTAAPPNRNDLHPVQLTPPGLNPWDRTLSFSDLAVFEGCELAYKKRKGRERKAPRDVHKIIGDLTHRGAAAGDEDSREADLVRQLRRLPSDMREEAERVVRELIATDAELDEAGGDVQDKQKDKLLLRCAALYPYWELVAKPDETGLIDDGRVLQLVEKKTSFRLKKKNKDQVFFAGMVAQVGRALSHSGPIKLVIRLLRSGEEHEFWYSRKATERNMFRISYAIRKIEEAVATGNFKASTGEQCFHCDYRNNCEAFALWAAREKAETKVVPLTVLEHRTAVGE